MPTQSKLNSTNNPDEYRSYYRGHRKRFRGTLHECRRRHRQWMEEIDDTLGPPDAPQYVDRLTTVRECLDTFLAHQKRINKQSTYEGYFYPLRNFRAYIGEETPIANLRKADATRWIELNWLVKRNGEPMGHNCIRHAKRSLKSCFAWCLDQELIGRNPFAGVKPGMYRPCEDYITDEQMQLILDHFAYDQDFCDYLMFMRLTGARVQEARHLTAAQIDHKRQRIVMQNKTEHQTGNKRVILLNEEALEVAQRHMLRHPEGPIFRNSNGDPWKTNAVRCRFVRAEKTLGFRPQQKNLRHSWATYYLIDGGEIATGAELMGHADKTMMLRNYQHVAQESQHMYNEAGRGSQGRFNRPEPPAFEAG